MQVTREDLHHLDEIIRALSKLRFDLSGTECMRLAESLAWIGAHRQKMDTEIQQDETKKADRVKAALASLDAPKEPPANLFTPETPAPRKSSAKA